MWKSVENVTKGTADLLWSHSHAGVCLPLRACSACAGDYEDPERTAGVFDEANDEERDETLHADVEQFPADDQ
jgi:hypothetical protein